MSMHKAARAAAKVCCLSVTLLATVLARAQSEEPVQPIPLAVKLDAKKVALGE